MYISQQGGDIGCMIYHMESDMGCVFINMGGICLSFLLHIYDYYLLSNRVKNNNETVKNIFIIHQKHKHISNNISIKEHDKNQIKPVA